MKAVLPASLCSLWLLACATAPSKNDHPSLCDRFPGELTFIHQTLSANDSNYNGSPEQKQSADEAFKSGIGQRCFTDLDYVRGIKKYLASYHDPHVTSLWSKPDKIHESVIEASTGQKPPPPPLSLQYTATGLFLQRYQDHYLVKSIDRKVFKPDAKSDAKVDIGDEVKGCDGKNPRLILVEDILPYLPVSAFESAAYRFTPLVFYRWDKEAGTSINCEIIHEGHLQNVLFTWQSVPDDYLTKTFLPGNKGIYETESIPLGHWVKLHSFAGYDQASVDDLKKFVSDAKRLRRDKLIVVDIRGNTGGNSNWGTDWIDQLYGYHVDTIGKIQESVFVSTGNRAHFQRFYDRLKAQGGIDSKYAEDNWKDLLSALGSHPEGTFAVLEEPPALRPLHASKSSFKGTVIVLTDPYVFSSAETFLEQLKMMPKVKQAGLASNASTYYSDIRFVVTPAGLPFNFPTKMDSGDPLGRKSGEALQPDWPLDYDGAAEVHGVDSLRKALEHRISER